MKLAYIAANYFIEVLFRSPNQTIDFNNLKTFRKLIGKEVCLAVAKYLDKESQDDFLFIFRNFPDVFLLQPDAITFTDTFTFLHNHLDSYEFYFNGARDKRTILYLENYAVNYFFQCLKSLGPQHYVFLFTRIMNDKTNPFRSYFQLHNVFDSQIFFEAHADIFLVTNNIVSLRKEKLLTNPLLSKTLTPNIMLVFENAVYFLLTCFKSLHYIELRQCICYVFPDVKNILNRFPVIKQREFFEMLPHLNMTQLGYLSLKCMNVNICIPSLDQTNLFIVCLLAFKKYMHYKQIVKEVNLRVPSTSNCLKALAEAELLQFFNNFPVLFKTSYEGYISLLPTFIFPVFTTEILYNQQNDHDTSISVDLPENASTSKKSILVPVDIHMSTSNTDRKSLNFNESLQLQGVSSMQNDILSAVDNNCKHFLGTLMLPENINKQIRLSILLLVKHFHPVDKQCVLKTLFHVMEEVYNAFCNLSTSDRHLFISFCSQFINGLSKDLSEVCIAENMFEGIEKKVLLLFIAYPLTSEREMHFEKIVKSLEEKKLNNPISSLSFFEQYKYFQEMEKYLNMGCNGYVSLAPPFELIKRNVDTYSGFLSEKCCTSYSEMIKCIKWKKEKVMKAEISVFELLNCSFPVTGHKVPLNIRKILLTALHLFKKHIKPSNIQQIFKASVFILEDLRNYLYNLSVNEQNDFVNECHQFLLMARRFKEMLEQDVFCVVDITTKERDNLFIAYLLTWKTINNHIQGIIDKLMSYGVCESITSRKAEDQFKYFEETSQYFSINSDGYISLQSSFNQLKLIIDAKKPVAVNQGDGSTSKTGVKKLDNDKIEKLIIDAKKPIAVNQSDDSTSKTGVKMLNDNKILQLKVATSLQNDMLSFIDNNDHGTSKSVDIPENASTSKKSILVPVDIHPSTSETDPKSLNVNESLQLQVVPSLQSDILSVIDNNCKHFPGTLMLPESINKQTRLSILFLVKHFHPDVDKQSVLLALFHVMEEVHNAFSNLSRKSDKRLFISFCCQFINALSDNVSKVCVAENIFEDIEKKVFLLFIAYLLTSEKKIHFEKIVKSLENKKINNPISPLSVSKQYNYFQEMYEYLTMKINGYVSLAPPFQQIKKNIDAYTKILSETCCTTKSKVSKDKHSSSEISKMVPEILNCSFSVTGHKVPLNIRKILLTAHHLLKKHVNAVDIKRIFNVSVFVLEDLRKCVYNLSVNERNDFCNECHQFMLKAKSFKKRLKQDFFCVANITTEQRDNLFIAYLLIRIKVKNHIQGIIGRLRRYDICKSLTSKKPEDQFKYFEETSQYFIISSDGYINFKASFYSLTMSIDMGSVSENGFPKEQKKLDKTGCSNPNPQSNQNTSKTAISEKCPTASSEIVKHPDRSDKVMEAKMSAMVSELLNCSFPVTGNKVPLYIRKILLTGHHLLRKNIRDLDTQRVFEASVFIFEDLRKYVYNLSVNERKDFLCECYQFIAKTSGYQKTLQQDVFSVVDIITEEKDNLFIAYVLSGKETSNHIRTVIGQLKKYNLCKSFTKKKYTDQFKYFEETSQYFSINSVGYITFQSSFNDLKQFIDIGSVSEILFSKEQNKLDLTGCSEANPQSNHSTFKTGAKGLNYNEILQSEVAPSLQNDKLSVIDKNCKYFFNTLMLSESINKQTRLSILFLVKYFHPVDKQRVFMTFFHVREEVRNAFCNLSIPDRRLFIAYCSQFMNALSDHLSKDCIAVTMIEGMEKEMLLLFIAYLLTSEKEMHFQKIMTSLLEKTINNPISSLSVPEQYKYFQEMKKYVKMGSNDYASLAPPFELIKKNVDTYTSFLSEKCCTTNSEMLKETSRKDKVLNAEISAVVSKILNCSFPVTGNKVPLHIRKVLLTAHHLLRKHIGALDIQQIFKASVFVLEDLRKYVYNLSVNERKDFVNECYHFITKEISCKKTYKHDMFYIVDISTEERDNLFIAYLLTGKETNNHIQSVIGKLRMYGMCKSLTSKIDKDQFKYFEETSQYFVIDSAGYISFQSLFNHLKLITDIGTVSENGLPNRQKDSTSKTNSVMLKETRTQDQVLEAELLSKSYQDHEKLPERFPNASDSAVFSDVLKFSQCSSSYSDKLCEKTNEPYDQKTSQSMSNKEQNNVKDNTNKKYHGPVRKKLLDLSQNSCNGEGINRSDQSTSKTDSVMLKETRTYNQVLQSEVSELLNCSLPVTGHKVPLDIRKILLTAHHLFRKHIQVLDIQRMFEASMFVLQDLKKYVYNLPVNERNDFVFECYQFFAKTKSFEKTLQQNDFCVAHISPKDRDNLFIAYFLSAKETDNHFQSIMYILKEHFMCESLTSKKAADRFKYFEETPQYFVINSDGHVSLQSSFKHLKLNANTKTISENEFGKRQKRADKAGCSKPNPKANHCISKTTISNLDAKSLNDNKSFHLQFAPSLQNDMLSVIDKNCKYFFHTLMLPESIIKQIRLSIIFLVMHFHPVAKQCVLITLFHVMEEVHDAFCNLSMSDRRSFMSSCNQFITALSNKETKKHIAINMFKGMENEVLLLYIAYLLTSEREMHFEKIVKSFEEKKISNPISSLSVSEQYNYFREMKKCLKMGSNGYVSLAPPFEIIKRNVHTYSAFMSDKCCTSDSEMVKDSRKKGKVMKAEIATVVSEILNCSFPVTGNKVPLDIRKFLLTALHLFKKHIQYSNIQQIFKASVFVLRDVRKYVFNLSVDEQNDFVNECHQFLLKARSSKVMITEDAFCVMNISTQELDNLFIVYLLTWQTINSHIQDIIKTLKSYGVCKSLTSRKAEDQFKYFEETSQYFTINFDGYISLQSSFNQLKMIIDASKPVAINQGNDSTLNTNSVVLEESRTQYQVLKAELLEMPERSPSPSDSAMYSDMSNVSDSSSAYSDILHGKKKEANVKNKSQSMSNLDRNAEKGKANEKSSNQLAYSISTPKGLNNKIVENRITFNSPVKPGTFENKLASNLEQLVSDEPSNAFTLEKSTDITKVSESVSVSSEQPLWDKLALLHNSCYREDVTSASSVSTNIASGSSNLFVRSETSEPFTKNISKINSVCTMQTENLSDTEGTKISKVKSKLVYENISSKLKSTHEILKNCHKNLSTHTDEFNADYTNNASNSVNNLSVENYCSDYRSILNNKSNSPSNKISISDKGTKDLSMCASSSAGTPKPKYTQDLSAEITRNTSCAPMYKSCKVRMPSQKSYVEMYLSNTAKSNKTFTTEQFTKTFYPSIQTCDKLSLQNNYNFSDNGVPFSSSIECFISSDIVDPQKSSKILCYNFSNAPSSEQDKSLLDWPNISFCDTAAKGDCQISEAVQSNYDGPKMYSSKHSEKSSIVPEQSAINLKECNCDSVQEMRAVNFFCVILGNYQKYNCGISAGSLKKHLVQASGEVQSVIRDNYENDFLSFFKKHKNEFYVSPRSQDIYLQKK